MLGIEKTDQLIAYYCPKIRCRRTWMPLMFHGLDIARVNAYIIVAKLGWKQQKYAAKHKAHKAFLEGFV